MSHRPQGGAGAEWGGHIWTALHTLVQLASACSTCLPTTTPPEGHSHPGQHTALAVCCCAHLQPVACSCGLCSGWCSACCSCGLPALPAATLQELARYAPAHATRSLLALHMTSPCCPPLFLAVLGTQSTLLSALTLGCSSSTRGGRAAQQLSTHWTVWQDLESTWWAAQMLACAAPIAPYKLCREAVHTCLRPSSTNGAVLVQHVGQQAAGTHQKRASSGDRSRPLAASLCRPSCCSAAA